MWSLMAAAARGVLPAPERSPCSSKHPWLPLPACLQAAPAPWHPGTHGTPRRDMANPRCPAVPRQAAQPPLAIHSYSWMAHGRPACPPPPAALCRSLTSLPPARFRSRKAMALSLLVGLGAMAALICGLAFGIEGGSGSVTVRAAGGGGDSGSVSAASGGTPSDQAAAPDLAPSPPALDWSPPPPDGWGSPPSPGEGDWLAAEPSPPPLEPSPPPPAETPADCTTLSQGACVVCEGRAVRGEGGVRAGRNEGRVVRGQAGVTVGRRVRWRVPTCFLFVGTGPAGQAPLRHRRLQCPASAAAAAGRHVLLLPQLPPPPHPPCCSFYPPLPTSGSS